MNGLTLSEPLTVTEDGAVIERLRISRPDGFAIIVKASRVIIQECDISGAILLYGPVAGVTIRNNYIHDQIPTGDHFRKKQFSGVTTTDGPRWGNPLVQPMGARDISIVGNFFKNCSNAAMLNDCRGDILFRGNYCENARGPFPRGEMIQIGQYRDPDGQVLIDNNFSYVNPNHEDQRFRGDFTDTGVEDHISVFMCYGSEKHPITVSNNYIYGHSTSSNGSGIMTGDSGGAYQQVLYNKVYQTGNAGIGLCSGHHLTLKGNRIYQNPRSCQYNGKGIQIDNYGDPFEPPIIVEDNVVYWACGKGDGSLLCTADRLVSFARNSFNDLAAFGELDPMPLHVPPEPAEGLMKPWE